MSVYILYIIHYLLLTLMFALPDSIALFFSLRELISKIYPHINEMV